MRRFTLFAGSFFALVCAVWLTRLVLSVSLLIDSYDVPVWLSVLPIVISGTFAVWAFRLLSAQASTRPD
jgi:hypothetical protein